MPSGPSAIETDAVRRIILTAIAERTFPAASVEVGTAGGVLWKEAFGTLTFDTPAVTATVDTLFDLASLTKVVATATCAMCLADSRVLPFDTPVAARLAGWQNPDRQGITVRDLLEHRSGLPAWMPLFETCATSAEYLAAIDRCALAYEPRTASCYSDLGFMLLGWVIEAAGCATLDRQFDAILSAAAGEAAEGELRFRPPAAWLHRLAPTRTHAGRGRTAAGEVDDDNAWRLGGVSGHAGLFGTAGALGWFARAVMRTLSGDADRGPLLARPAIMRECVSPSSVPDSSRGLGWDTMRPTSSCGTRMSTAAFGHTGFTGTSLWIDPAAGVYVVLLTNRVHPQAGPIEAIQRVRQQTHDAVMDGLR